LPETTEIIQMIERTNLLCRESNSKVHHYLIEVETRLTQFEEMKTAFILLLIETSYCYFIRNDLNKSELENYKKIKNFLASLSETNEKP